MIKHSIIFTDEWNPVTENLVRDLVGGSSKPGGVSVSQLHTPEIHEVESGLILPFPAKDTLAVVVLPAHGSRRSKAYFLAGYLVGAGYRIAFYGDERPAVVDGTLFINGSGSVSGDYSLRASFSESVIGVSSPSLPFVPREVDTVVQSQAINPPERNRGRDSEDCPQEWSGMEREVVTQLHREFSSSSVSMVLDLMTLERFGAPGDSPARPDLVAWIDGQLGDLSNPVVFEVKRRVRLSDIRWLHQDLKTRSLVCIQTDERSDPRIFRSRYGNALLVGAENYFEYILRCGDAGRALIAMIGDAHASAR